MEAVPAAELRRLLLYDATTAGGLMTSQPLIVTPDVSVAEVLARVRDPDMPVTTAVQVFVCEPPIITPTGRFLGTVGFQRLLRRAPATKVGDCVQSSVFVRPDLPERELAARLAAYNLVSVAVCDEDGRLLGAVTVETPVTAAVQVYVCEPPVITPTGRYLGSVGFQRLLRRPPATPVGDCVQSSVFVRPDLPERELAARLAAYNLVSVAVCDEDGRLLGAVTVDDVLDHVLPDDWRKTGG